MSEEIIDRILESLEEITSKIEDLTAMLIGMKELKTNATVTQRKK